MAKDTTVFEAARQLRSRDRRVALQVTPATPSADPPSIQKFDSKRNKQFLKDKAKLDALPKGEIEKIRARIIAKRKADELKRQQRAAEKLIPLPQ